MSRLDIASTVDNAFGPAGPTGTELGALGVIAELRHAISTGEVEGRSGRPIHLSPTQRREADRALAALLAIEHHNAFTAPRTGEPYRTRRNAMEALHTASPPLKGVVADRLAGVRIGNAFGGEAYP